MIYCRVVVGVRFKLHERMLHIQIKENKILDRYHINVTKNENWVKLPKIRDEASWTRSGVSNPRELEGTDFVVWDRHKYGFNFDELILSSERVLTGNNLFNKKK